MFYVLVGNFCVFVEEIPVQALLSIFFFVCFLFIIVRVLHIYWILHLDDL